MQASQMNHGLHAVIVLYFPCNRYSFVVRAASPCPKGHTDKIRVQIAKPL